MHFFLDLFAKLNKLDELIRWGGYTVIAVIVFAETGLLVGFFLPGDSLLVTAGLFASTGQLNIVLLFLLLAFMAVIGDAFGYWIGRKAGPKIFSREKSILFAKDHLITAREFFERYGNKAIILARFMPIVRTFVPVVAGVGEMPYARFFTYNVIGGVAWVAAMLGIGYTLGRSVPDIDKKINVVVLVVIILSIVPGVIEYYRHHRKKRASA